MSRTIWMIFLITWTASNALDQEFFDEFVEKLQDIGTSCAEEVHATPDDIAELIAKQIPPSTHEGKCMIFCIQKNFNMMKSDGSLNRAGAVGVLRPIQAADPSLYQKLLKLFVTCGMRVKPVADPCETATLLATCGKEEALAMGLSDELAMLR